MWKGEERRNRKGREEGITKGMYKMKRGIREGEGRRGI